MFFIALIWPPAPEVRHKTISIGLAYRFWFLLFGFVDLLAVLLQSARIPN